VELVLTIYILFKNIKKRGSKISVNNPQVTKYHSGPWRGVSGEEIRNQCLALVNTVMNLRVSIKGGEFLEKLSNYQLLKKEQHKFSQIRENYFHKNTASYHVKRI
jgi:hypothetical protein